MNSCFCLWKKNTKLLILHMHRAAHDEKYAVVRVPALRFVNPLMYQQGMAYFLLPQGHLTLFMLKFTKLKKFSIFSQPFLSGFVS